MFAVYQADVCVQEKTDHELPMALMVLKSKIRLLEQATEDLFEY
jgi:hypothetical protein